MDELRLAEDLQRAVWGAGDLPDPADLMMVIQEEGGLVGGAFVDGALVGYVFGFPTRDAQVQHSHRLAVLDKARSLGLGVGLKRYQRDWCLARGIQRVRWTFDPLLAINATLNIHRLGATSNVYLEDYYGAMGGINSGIASDRLLVDWDLASPIVTALSRGERRPQTASEPVDFAIPEDLAALTKDDLAQARDLRLQLRLLLQRHFADGYFISDFDRHRRTYLVSQR